MSDKRNDGVQSESTGQKQDQHQSGRRQVLKSTLAGGAVISTSILPEKWTKPAVDSVILPAHAGTTGSGGDPGAGTTQAPPATTVAPTTTPSPTTTFNPNLTMLDL